MSWTLAADWLSVAGLSLLTVGTGAQARGTLAEYKNILNRANVRWPGRKFWEPPYALWLAVVTIPRTLASIRDEGGDLGPDAARLLRETAAWTVLMIGSALILSAAVIQLALA